MTLTEQMKADGMTCAECGKPTDMTFHGLCRNCIIDSMDYDPDVDDRYEADEYDDCGLMPKGWRETDWPEGFCRFTAEEMSSDRAERIRALACIKP